MNSETMPKSAFKNSETEKLFGDKGFVKIDSLALNCIEPSQKLYNSYLSTQKNVFNYSLMQLDADLNFEVHQKLQAIFSSVTAQLFQQFKFLSGSFLTKPSNFAEEMFLHQDWTFTDEEKFSPVTMWIALDDVTEEKGALFFLPGSHLFFNNFRSFDYETFRFPYQAELKKHLEVVSVKKGDVVLFHPAVFHGSFANTSGIDRVVVSATVLPTEAPFIHVKKKNNATCSIQYLDDNVFFRDLRKCTEKDAFSGFKVQEMPYSHQPVEISDLLKYFQSHV